MAMRAASICREVMNPQVIACRPYSPKTTEVAPLETPLIFPFCCFRHLTFLGASIQKTLSLRQSLRPLRQDLALEDPALDPDGAVRGVRLGGAVLDVGPQG